nr:ATP synthase F1 subunit delta [uncultured Gemmiger sp.]
MTDVGKMYGGALYELTAEDGCEEAARGQLREVVALLRENPDYEKLLCTPSIPKTERCALLDEALRGQIEPYVLNFLKILCENGTLRQLSSCEKEFTARYNKARGIVPARAVSAVPLSDKDVVRLKEKLESLTGKKVDLTTAVDPACLGGIRLEMDGVRFDGTVEGRLERLRHDLENIVL